MRCGDRMTHLNSHKGRAALDPFTSRHASISRWPHSLNSNTQFCMVLRSCVLPCGTSMRSPSPTKPSRLFFELLCIGMSGPSLVSGTICRRISVQMQDGASAQSARIFRRSNRPALHAAKARACVVSASASNQRARCLLSISISNKVGIFSRNSTVCSVVGVSFPNHEKKRMKIGIYCEIVNVFLLSKRMFGRN